MRKITGIIIGCSIVAGTASLAYFVISKPNNCPAQIDDKYNTVKSSYNELTTLMAEHPESTSIDSITRFNDNINKANESINSYNKTYPNCKQYTLFSNVVMPKKKHEYDKQVYDACSKWANPKGVIEAWNKYSTCYEIADRCDKDSYTTLMKSKLVSGCEAIHNGFRTNASSSEKETATEVMNTMLSDIQKEKEKANYVPPYRH